MKHTLGPRAASEEMEPFSVYILLDTHYLLKQNRNFFQRNSDHFTLIFMCRTDRKKNPSWEARRSAFDKPTRASIRSLFAFCINKCCNLVQCLRKSLEFAINLLSSFYSTGFQGVTHLLSKLSDSRPHERC